MQSVKTLLSLVVSKVGTDESWEGGGSKTNYNIKHTYY